MTRAKQDYIANLQAAISRLYGCQSAHQTTVPVHETFHGGTVWQGFVEVFDLTQHPTAKRAYAWAERDKTTAGIVVLELPPVKDAKTAVEASVVAGGQS